VRGLDGAVADRIGDLRRPDDLAGRKGLDLELAVGGLADILREHLGGAVDGVERLREAGLQAPAHLRHRLRDRWRGNAARGRRDGGAFQEGASLELRLRHAGRSLFWCYSLAHKAQNASGAP
jgi:hypothetical protein